jgi:hypothetical protein
MEEEMIKMVMRRSTGTASWRAVMSLLCLLLLGVGSGHAAPAPNANSVLILGSTARNPASPSFIEGHEATLAGFTVVVASDAEWAAMTTADFASYRAIIFADGMCSGNSSFKAAIANQDVWAPAITGNVIVMGNHPGTSALSTTTAQDFVQNALQFVAASGTTGAYITLGCYMSAATQTDVPVLKPFGQFSVIQQNGCSDSVHLVASEPNLGALNDTNMSGWACTTDAEFVNWDNSFTPFAVATNVSGQFIDPSTGATVSPYILVRGAQVTPLTTLQAAPSSPAPPAAKAMSVPVPGDPTVDLSMPMTSGIQPLYNGPVTGLLTHDGNWGLTGNLTATVSWSPNSDIAVQYDSNHMEQGDTPGTVDTLTPGHGGLCMNFNGSFDVVLDGHSVGLESVNNQSVCGECPLATDGSAYKCSLGEQKIEVLCVGLDIVDGCIDLTVTPTAFVTPQPFSTDRTVFYDGTAAGNPSPSVISFPPSPVNDPVQLSCVEPAGTDVVYQLANPRTTAPLSNFGIELGLAGTLQEGICPACFQQTAIDEPNIVPLPLPAGDLTLSLTGPTGQVDLGAVQKETSVPDLTAVSTAYAGKEGSPIQFSATGAKDKCLDSSSLVWNFSDHGVAYGFSPFHTFEDADVFSGQLVVTNIGGNSATKAFSVTVQNVPPTVTAGPDTTAPWGVPVAFNGSGTAAGADDQATLTYAWTFGDGSPSATGGPSVFHAYSAPGSYTATLKVCDEDGFCSSASRQVIVRSRSVTVGYLGDQQGVYNTLTNLSGSLVDELGHAVPGRTIVFAISTEAGGAAATNSTGGASTTHLLGLPAGSYMASAAFAGDSLYNAAGPVYAAYTVTRKPTVVTYTGALTGGPNKTISLSAVLVDSQNHPLAGKVIAFKLGSQSASATTNASGVAATTLALNQRNASYTLTATYTTMGADTNLYLGSVASATFKLQVK